MADEHIAFDMVVEYTVVVIGYYMVAQIVFDNLYLVVDSWAMDQALKYQLHTKLIMHLYYFLLFV